MARYLTEFLGSFFLVLTVGLVVVGGSPLAPVAIGSALMALVHMGFHSSGAHYNPAVTLALFARGDLPRSNVPGYLAAQLLGSGVAAVTCFVVLGTTFSLAPSAGGGMGATLLVEALFTFLLVLVIFNVGVSPKTKGNGYYGLAIGLTITGAAFAGGPISGGAFNPAVGVMPGVIQLLLDGQTSTPFWIYVVGPIAGGLLAVPVFNLQEAETSTA